MKYHQGLRAALVLFAVAVLTGAAFRFGILYGWTSAMTPENVRHAHSHLMYFGWATPALFVLLATRMDRGLRIVVWSTLALAFAAFGSFLLYGYQSAQWGSARLPLSVMLAGLNMIAWYGWVLWRRRGPRDTLISDAAVVFLIGASIGAWGIAMVKPLGIGGPLLESGLAHQFLGWFADGWFLLGVLALAFRGRIDPGVKTWLTVFVIGTGLAFLVSMPEGSLSASMRGVARVAGAVAGIGTVGLVWLWWRSAGPPSRGLWAIPMWCLLVKAGGQIAAMVAFDTWWADHVGLRVLYLHLLLLGFVSGGLIAAAAQRGMVSGVEARVFQGSTLLVIATLIPFTQLWPPFWGGLWTMQAVAWAAPLPAVAALWIASRLQSDRR